MRWPKYWNFSFSIIPSNRGTSNYSEATDLILVGFRVCLEINILLLLLFLPIYPRILLGNVGMMVIIMTDPQLNTPIIFS